MLHFVTARRMIVNSRRHLFCVFSVVKLSSNRTITYLASGLDSRKVVRHFLF